MKSDSKFILALQVNEVWDWMLEIYDLPRSLMNAEYKETLRSIESTLGDMTLHTWKTGQAVGDWTVPKDWKVNKAFIADGAGHKIVDISQNSLHLAAYSTSVSAVMSFQELSHHLCHSEKIEDAIPYLTHYYQEAWSFCVTASQLKKLAEHEKLQVEIDSFTEAGELVVGELSFNGTLKSQINFNTYLCHPALANNELSGPAISILVGKYLTHLQSTKGLRHTYSIFWEPETIGAIALLSKKKDYFQDNLLAGYVLTCLGDEHNYGFISARKDSTLSERMLVRSLKEKKVDFIKYPFSQRGSDERQFCWPTVDLPYTCFFRSKFEEYDEYHTSKDDLTFVSKDGLQSSMNLIMAIIDDFETSHFPISKTLGEPFLSKYMHYGVPGRTGPNQNAAKVREFLCYCDGRTSTKEISELIGLDIGEVDDLLEFLIELDLVSI